jgi:hypothetical protein
VRASIAGHLSICRFDHWFKNVFVLPGILMAVALEPPALSWDIVPRALLGLLGIVRSPRGASTNRWRTCSGSSWAGSVSGSACWCLFHSPR